MNAPIRTPKILTDAQYEAMARKGAFVGLGRVELRGGVVVDMEPAFLAHSRAMTALMVASAHATPGLALAALAKVSIRFGGGFQPTADIVIWDPAGVAANYDGPIPGEAVKLVIEVADASLGDDLGDKMRDYAAAGLAEYWVADVRARVIHQHTRPQDGEYKGRTVTLFGDPAVAATIPLTLDTTGL